MNKFQKEQSKRRISLLLSMVMFFSILFGGTPISTVFAEGTNLVINGDLELWTSGKPTGWEGKFENAEQGTTAHSGSSSIKHTSSSKTKDVATLVRGIVPGKEYTISFWYYDGDNNARIRPWMSWKKADGKQYSEEVTPEDKKVLQPSTYLEEKNGWAKWEVKLTAPSDADSFNFEIRVYKQDAPGGAVYYDDLFFGTEGPAPVETKVSNVLANPPAGKVMSGTAVSLNTVTTGTAIYYTVDGTSLGTTTAGALLYSAPITVDQDMVIHAVAVKEGLDNSDEAVFNYEVLTEDDFDKIYDIQGESHTSSMVGDSVKVIGIVTAVSNDKYDKGVYIQDPVGDGNDNTSDGIFVRGSGIQANVGDKLLVEGRVQEKLKYPAKGNDDAGQLSITEIQKFKTTVLESGLQLPAPVVLGEGGRALITQIIDNDNFQTFDPQEDAIDLYESLEGMLVKVNNPHIVGVEERYGTFDILADNGAASLEKLNPRGGIKLTADNYHPEILYVDDVVTPLAGSNKQFLDSRFNMAKVGDDFAGSIVGVMDYNFGLYKIYNTAPLPDIVPGSNARETTTITYAEDKLTISVYNVENFAATEEQTSNEKVERIANSIINELGKPDILALVEVQDNNGPSKEGDSEANESYERLINEIIKQGGPTYAYTDIAPVMNQDGGQPGGNIRVGYIYRADRVGFTGEKGGQLEAAVMNGKHLAKNPMRIDPTNPNFESTRKSLVGEFVFRGESIFVISNHFSSKRGDQPEFGNTQPPVKGSEPRRHEQARAVNTFVKSILAADSDAKVVVLGDMNDYEYSETLNVLAGEELFNMLNTLDEKERYSYIYGGRLQVLDNMLVSKNMKDDTIVDVVHVNAEFTEHSGRASDHDPVMVQISNMGNADFIAPVEFSQEAGFVKKGSQLELTTSETDGEIFYTMGYVEADTEDPISNGTKYENAIVFDSCRPYYIKAVVKKDGKFSEVKEMQFDVDLGVMTFTPNELSVYEGTVLQVSADDDTLDVYYTDVENNYDTSTYLEFPAEGLELNQSKTFKFVLKSGSEWGIIFQRPYTVMPEVEVSSIADAKAKADDERVRVQGIVTSKIGNNIFIQDATAGLYVYVGGSAKDEFVVGNELELVGYTAQFNDLKQIKNIKKIKVLSTGNDLPAAEEVTINAINESKEGKLVTVKGLKITKVDPNKKKGYTIKTTDGSSNLDLRIDKYLGEEVDSNKYSAGMYIDVTAPVGQFKNTYQLMIRSESDIVAGQAPVTVEKKIYEVQGAGHTSPFVGKKVKVVGIVTAVSNDKYDAGIYIQDATGDGDDKTSDGIFVRGKGITAVVGDLVEVEGMVGEKLKYPAKGNDDAGQLSITEITVETVTVKESGKQLPAPVVLGEGGRALITDIIDNDNFQTFDPEQDAIDLYESLEGMLVKVNNPHIVGVEERYGTFDILADNGAASLEKLNPRGGIKLTKNNFNPEILYVDDVVTPLTGSNKQFLDSRFNMAKVGDDFAGSITGVMDYSFGLYKIYNTAALPDIVPGSNARETTTITYEEDKLTVAVYNVENFAASEEQTPNEKVERIAHSIISELGQPDILALVEVQDNNGPNSEGDSEANESYERLINEIIKQGGPTYSYTDIAPVMNQDGGQPGGNIRVGYIYRADRVGFTGEKGGQLEAAVMNGKHLAKNPMRIDPTNSNFQNTRKSLVGEFTFKGESVFVIANHFSSKRGDQPEFGNTQPPVKGSEPRRHEQARAVNTFVKSILAADANANVVVLGDMNDYEYSETMKVLAGEEMFNMLDTLEEKERYSYIYGGRLQVLDNMLVSKNMKDDTVVDVVHVNAEFTEHSGRASDHDPVMIQISNIGNDDFMAPVDFSLPKGFAKKGSQLELTTSETDGEIFYTMGHVENDTENPVTNGTKYENAIVFDSCRPYYIKAVVKKDGKYSEVKGMQFDVDLAKLTITPKTSAIFEGELVKATTDEADVKVFYTTVKDNYDRTTFVEFPAEGIAINEETSFMFTLKKDDEWGMLYSRTFAIKPEVELSTIADAKAKENDERVKVKGIVTGKIGNNIFIQDATAGLYVYVGGSAKEEFVVGNELELVGYTAQFNDLEQIKNIKKINILSTGNDLPEAEEVTIDAIDESKEGKLVTVKGLEITKVDPDLKKGYTIKATDGTNTLALRIDKYLGVEVDSNKYSVGMNIDVTAPVGQFRDTYQLMIRSENDIVKPQVGDIAPVKFSMETGFAVKGSTIELSTDEADAEIFYTIGYNESNAQDPKTNGTKYENAIELNQCQPYFIKAVVKKNGNFSEMTTVNLDVDLAVLEAPLSSEEIYEGTVITATASIEGVEVYYTDVENNFDLGTFEKFPAEGIVLTESKTITYILKKGEEWGALRLRPYTILEEVEVSTIAEAKAKANGERVRVQGVVTAKIGNNIFIQDATAGLYVYVGRDAKAEFVVGNKLELVGYTGEFMGLKQIKSIKKIAVISEDNVVDGQLVSAAEIGENVEGKLVRVENLEITKLPENKTKGYSIEAMQGETKVTLRVDKYLAEAINSNDFKVGYVINVTAPVGQFKNTYQLMLGARNDIEIAKLPGILTIEEAMNMPIGTKATVKGFLTNRDLTAKKFIIQDSSCGIELEQTGFLSIIFFKKFTKLTVEIQKNQNENGIYYTGRIEGLTSSDKFIKDEAITLSEITEEMNFKFVRVNDLTIKSINKEENQIIAGDENSEITLVMNSIGEQYEVGMKISVEAPIKYVDGKPNMIIETDFNIIPEGIKEAPVRVENSKTFTTKIDENGKSVREAKNTFKVGEMISISTEIKSDMERTGTVIFKILGPNNNVHLITYSQEEMKDLLFGDISKMISTSLPAARKGEYRVQITVWESMDSQKVLSEMKEIKFEIK